MTTLIQYRGDVVAVAGASRFHLAPHIEAREPGDPLRAVVALMCVFAERVHAGELPGPYSDARAELYARCALIADDEFERAEAEGESDEAVAVRFNVPIEQIERSAATLGTEPPALQPSPVPAPPAVQPRWTTAALRWSPTSPRARDAIAASLGMGMVFNPADRGPIDEFECRVPSSTALHRTDQVVECGPLRTGGECDARRPLHRRPVHRYTRPPKLCTETNSPQRSGPADPRRSSSPRTTPRSALRER